MQFVVRGTVSTGHETLDHAISDLEIISAASTVTVLASSGANGGLTSYALTANSAARVIDGAYFNPSWALGISDRVALTSDGAGGLRAVVGATSAQALGIYSVSLQGEIGSVTHVSGLESGFGAPDALGFATDGTLLLSGATGGFSSYTLSGNSLTSGLHTADTDFALVSSVSSMVGLKVAGSDIVVAGSGTETGITSYLMTDSGPRLVDRSGPDEGVGVMCVTDLAATEVGSNDYVVVGSAQDATGALSVFRVGSDGTLTRSDHIIDTLSTRFGGVQAVEIATVGAVSYVLAGGGDDGLSLFILLPDGHLQYMASIADRNDIGLQNVSAIAAAAVGDELRILAASQREAGLTDLAVDISNQGIQTLASSGGQAFGGASGDDILVGNTGNDRISGGGGNDILVDGEGTDVLTGGDGADLFVLRDDDAEDTITDFDPARDRLDLSSWPMFHDPASLEIVSTSTGANVTWRGVRLVLQSANGNRLDPAMVRAAVFAAPDRPMNLDKIVFPNDAGYDFAGTDGDDTIHGSPNDDVIAPGLGCDIVFGGDGNDTILPGFGLTSVDQTSSTDTTALAASLPDLGGDEIYGGGGNDIITTGMGDDKVIGGDGADQARLGDGNDIYDDSAEAGTGWRNTVYGEGGNDTLTGGRGSDDLHGGDGTDILHGGDGADTLAGNAQNDMLYGEAGTDRLFGGFGDDILLGGDDRDSLWGFWGNDVLHGNMGNDVLYGEAGNDKLFGGLGDDTLAGGDDNDSLWGFTGNDILLGNMGRDMLSGEGGTDKLFGGFGADSLYGGDDNDSLWGFWGNDLLFGNIGNDTLMGEAGDDKLFGGFGDDNLAGGDDNDALWGFLGSDTLQGNAGNDTLMGEAGNDKLLGGFGDDALFGGNDDDTLWGFLGNDTLEGNLGNDILFGEDGDDLMRGGDGNDKLWGGNGNDRMGAGTGNDTLYGNSGLDKLWGDEGDDALWGGSDNDELRGGNGNDLLCGEAGKDLLEGDDGDDRLNGGSGNDRLNGGLGADQFVFKTAFGTGVDSISDFGNGDDRLLIYGKTSSQVHFNDTVDGLSVSWDDGGVILAGLDQSQFHDWQIIYL